MFFLYLFLALMFIGAVFPADRSHRRGRHTRHPPTPRHYVGKTITGTVRRVVDGDGFLMVVHGTGESLRIRLGEIDAPEQYQPMGELATSMLRSLIQSKQITVRAHAIGPYGRLIGRAYINGPHGVIDVNAWLVEHGLAWVYRRYTRDNHLIQLEAEARAQALGIWSLPNDLQIAPWEWRSTHPRLH